MVKLTLTCAGAALAAVYAAVALGQPARFVHIGDRPATGRIETPAYRFLHTAPRASYAGMSWAAYADTSEKRNTTMLIGLSGYDSYALSVHYKGQAAEGRTALDLARIRYPSLSLGPGPNAGCVNTSLERPFELSNRMLNLMALCVDPRSGAVYELSLSWRSVVVASSSVDELLRSARDCAAARSKDPANPCVDALGSYAGAFRAFLSSFIMSGS